MAADFALTNPVPIGGRASHDHYPTIEELRIIEEWPGYLAGPDGHIWSTKAWRGVARRRLAEGRNRDGYHTVQLSPGAGGGGRTTTTPVHTLIARAFGLSKPEGSHDLRHLDGDKGNNRPDNLRWGTQKENADDRDRHGRTARGEGNGGAKLTELQAREIKARLAKGARQADLQREFNVPQSTMSAIARGRLWGWLGVG